MAYDKNTIYVPGLYFSEAVLQWEDLMWPWIHWELKSKYEHLSEDAFPWME